MSAEQRQEIEKILKEIYKKYLLKKIYEDTHELSSDILYYKLKGEELDYIKLNLTPFLNPSKPEVEYERFADVALNPRLEYALYTGFVTSMHPSYDCLRDSNYSTALSQFVSWGYSSNFGLPWLIRHVVLDNKDPLTHILIYKQLLSMGLSDRMYICLDIFQIIPYGIKPDNDSTSIFHGKIGVVAYCMAPINLFHVTLGADIDSLGNQLFTIANNADKKLKNNKKLKKLWKQDPGKACDINLIESIIHDELEEAEKLMRQYGIIRVAFPLE